MKKLSENSKKRLVILARILSQQSKKRITSVEISALTGWTEATIRRDISNLGLERGVSNGYDAAYLRSEIDRAFKINESQEQKHYCCIVGLGKLGEALLESSIFKGSAFEIVAGFDSNYNRIEIMKSDIPLFATLDLESKIHSLKIEYAILALPDEKAQFMADRLVKCGIRGILNYTNTILSLPEEVKVENASSSLLLTQMLAK
ncbi:MAG: redox-sensing transcriptional repressor Rex [Treponema sp.]|nr:redox-sensing transcriptional repressor Rex [Treponema sp.]